MLKTIPRLLLTRGIPGSGKTTWAKAMSVKYSNLVLVSRDDLRHTLYADYNFGNSSLEEFITVQQRALIMNALLQGKDVIVHDNNVNIQFVIQFKKHFARFATISIVDFGDIDINTCIERDKLRFGSKGFVGEVIVNKMNKTFQKSVNSFKWKKFEFLTPLDADALLAADQEPKNYTIYIPDQNLDDAIIIDIDGTLANIEHRSPFDHTKFHLDTLNHPIAKLSKCFTKTIILTGRDEKHRDITSDWLASHNMFYEKLHMRPEGDVRPDYVVKKEIFFNEIAPYYNVELIVEDRKQVVDMWRELGLICAQIDEGDF